MKITNPLVVELISIFSHDLVFAPNDEKILLNMTSINKIYDVLNKHVFNLKLNRIPIEIEQSYSNTPHIAGYDYRYVLLKNQLSYTLVTKRIVIPNGKILNPPKICINPNIVNYSTNLIFFVNVLCHEMIHQDDIENGTFLKRKYLAISNHKTFDSHYGYFENFAKQVNIKFNLNIQKEISSMEKGIELSLSAIRQALLEKDLQEVQKIEESTIEISDKEKIKLSIESVYDTIDGKCTYLGCGAFEETLF